MGKKWTLSRLYDKAAHRNFIHSRRITWAWNEWIECGYNWRHTTSHVGDDSYTIYQEFIRLFKPSWLGGAWGRGSGGYSGTYAANERKSKCSKQVQSEKTHAHWVNFNRERLRVRTIAWFCEREREKRKRHWGRLTSTTEIPSISQATQTTTATRSSRIVKRSTSCTTWRHAFAAALRPP